MQTECLFWRTNKRAENGRLVKPVVVLCAFQSLPECLHNKDKKNKLINRGVLVKIDVYSIKLTLCVLN